jgi:hypothetical protein
VVSCRGRGAAEGVCGGIGELDAQEFLTRTAGMIADASRVTAPFLSIVGAADSNVRPVRIYRGVSGRDIQRSCVVLFDQLRIPRSRIRPDGLTDSPKDIHHI